MDHAVAEPALVHQLELHADAVGERSRAAAHHDGADEQVALVDQTGRERLGGEPGPPTERSRPPDAFMRRTASGSKSRSIRVLALDAASSVLE